VLGESWVIGKRFFWVQEFGGQSLSRSRSLWYRRREIKVTNTKAGDFKVKILLNILWSMLYRHIYCSRGVWSMNVSSCVKFSCFLALICVRWPPVHKISTLTHKLQSILLLGIKFILPKYVIISARFDKKSERFTYFSCTVKNSSADSFHTLPKFTMPLITLHKNYNYVFNYITTLSNHLMPGEGPTAKMSCNESTIQTDILRWGNLNTKLLQIPSFTVELDTTHTFFHTA
jgi:hypothetical protein